MNSTSIFKTFLVCVVLGYLTINDNQAEARVFNGNELQNLDSRNININDLNNMARLINDESKLSNPLEQADNDDDDDDDDRSNVQLQNPLITSAGSITGLYNDAETLRQQPIYAEQSTQQQNKIGVPSGASDLKTSASHHHHGHGAKGWLKMDAWGAKKGAFGWHAKYPVGKKGKK